VAITNNERVGKALDLLKDGLGPFVEREFRNLHKDEALEHAQRVSRALALAAARRAGAVDPHVDTSVSEKLAHAGAGADYLAEAVARSTATGRPFAGHVGELRA